VADEEAEASGAAADATGPAEARAAGSEGTGAGDDEQATHPRKISGDPPQAHDGCIATMFAYLALIAPGQRRAQRP
jgi:hypothetical protein